MGKLKKRSRSARHRANPLASKAKQEKQDETLVQNKITPMMDKLKSAIPNEKSMALGTIAVMCEDPRFRRLLLKEKLVPLVLERCLTDANPEIVVESFGLLRNLVIEEGYDVAVYLWRQNIWITIEASLDKCKRGFDEYTTDKKKFGKVETTSLFDLIENLVSLITGLAGSSTDIFDQIYTKITPLRTFLKQILGFAVDLEKPDLRVSTTLFNAILDMLYDFSTQSVDFINDLTTEWELNLDTLQKFIDSVPRLNELSKVYIQGIKLQILEADHKIKNKDKEVAQIIDTTITNVQNVNIASARQILVTEVDNTKPEDLKMDLKKRIEARAQFQAVELAVEIITAAIEIVAASVERNGKRHQHNDELYAVLLQKVTEVLFALLNEVEFRARALTCVNNLCWLFVTVEYALEQWVQCLPKVWDAVMNVLTQEQSVELDVEEKMSAFGSLWAMVLVLGNDANVDDVFVQNTMEEYKTLLVSTEEDKEEYLTRLIGVLGNLAKCQGHVERNGAIGALFLETLSKANSVPGSVVVDILDILYEIYGDAEFDYDEPVFVQGKYISQLEQLTPKIKTAIKLIDKNVNPQLKQRADEVFRNLPRFIQYKKSER